MKEKLQMLKLVDILEPGHVLREAMGEEALSELKSSMGKRGLIQPIEVRPKDGKYEIVAGHRRFLAAKDLGWHEIKALVKDRTDEDTILDALHENLHREDMSPIEEGRAASLLMGKEGRSLKDIAKMFSKSESWVIGRLDLLEMDAELQEAVDVGALSVGAARELARIVDDASRKYYTDYAIKQGATAQLCAFWRGKWELERVVNDPSGNALAAQMLSGPPMTITLPCWWCNVETDIRLIDHLRVCPGCREALIHARAEYLRVGSAVVARD